MITNDLFKQGSASSPFVKASAIQKSYPVGQEQLHVIRDLQLDVARGEMIAVVGRSGVGKSTLLHLLGGLDRIDSGAVKVANIDLSGLSDDALVEFRNRHVGFVFQSHYLLPEFTAQENAEMPMRIAGMPLEEAREHATMLLEKVGLKERLTHKPSMLSGGEQQRVAMARALVMKPSLLLADEPTGDLDEETAESLHGLLREMHTDRGLTSIIATHNPTLARACDRVFRLQEGRLEFAGEF
mgnify:CR=1 FL=1